VSAAILESSPPGRSRGDQLALGLALSGLGIVMAGRSALWLLPGLLLSATGELTGRTTSGLDAVAVRWRAIAALILVAVGLSLQGRAPVPSAILCLAGLGCLAGWLPFAWRTSREDTLLLEESPRRRVRLLLRLISMTAALIVAGRLTTTLFEPTAERSLPALYLAAILSLGVATARLWSSRRIAALASVMAAMPLAGIVADVALAREDGRLPVTVPSGAVWGLAVWLHTAAVSLVLVWINQSQRTPSSDHSGWRRAIRCLAWCDLAGLPPLPGFWLRSGLLLALVSRQSPSNITGEFEPHSGLLTLALVASIAWAIVLATALSRALSLDDDSQAS
jgi:hypothetical protein